MIEIDKQLFDMYSSLEKLEKYDRFYEKTKNYDIRGNRYLLRSEIIDSNKLDIFNSCSKSIHEYNKRELNTMSIYDYMLDKVGMLDIVTSYRCKDSYRKKTERLKKRINIIFEYDNLFFVTFTFDDRKLKKGLNGTKNNVLRKYVVKWLKEYTNDYVGNVDFGGKFGRIHFHAVISNKDVKINHITWKYGAINFERIYTKNDEKISLYINKLCSHALKESTKAQYLIYPKK